MIRRAWIFIYILVLIISLSAVFALYGYAFGLPTVFGGRILFVRECLCTGGVAVTIGGPRPGTFLFQPGISRLFKWGQIYRPGPWTLGTYFPGGVCSSGTKFCTPIPVQGTINMVGTSSF